MHLTPTSLTALCAISSLLLAGDVAAAHRSRKPSRHHHHSKSSVRGACSKTSASAVQSSTSHATLGAGSTTSHKASTTSKAVATGSKVKASASQTTSSAPAAITSAILKVPEGANVIKVDFGDYTSGTTSDFLAKYNLHISAYSVASEPITHTFVPANVGIKDGKLELTVSSAGSASDVKSAEIFTEVDNMLFLNITTRAKIGKSKGVCSGFFTYLNDNQESDIEFLTSYITDTYGDAVPAGLEFTNQALKEGGKSTNTAVAYPWDPTADFHDYTLEWSSDATRFYVDGVLWKELTTNVPTKPSSFIWNSWSSGDPYWSAGPPTEDNVLQIESIVGWYYTA
ncbi:concanavalin A-like lectin/glucanase domain-containing protein [Leucosporidium creatinivorum]|uniref:Concanavalin A-like lectin/glucanase domain-containing protein n=1 Tax=Leucosporidium creatinivorum TaxID=106004 RepID=A0A1Y2G0S9_9BASI|nr:concanavalin A-like lectin/glucanase domain-containing protein [Leucosporidium creatinivorum]